MQETKYIRGSTLLEIPFLSSRYSGQKSPLLFRTPNRTFRSPDRLPDALHRHFRLKLLSAGDSFSLAAYVICYSFRSTSFSYRLYHM